MRRLLVTGGAGSSARTSSATCSTTPTTAVTVLDKLTYAGNLRSLDGLPDDRSPLVVRATSATPSWSTRWSPATTWSCTSPPSRTTTTRCATRRPFVSTNLIGTYTLLEAVRRHGTRYHHISTDEVYGDLELDDPERFTETTPYNPSSPYSVDQGGVGPAGPGLGALVRRPGHDQQLLQQLRAVPARGEVHPPADHQRDRRRPAQALRRGVRTCATGSTPTTTAPRCC